MICNTPQEDCFIDNFGSVNLYQIGRNTLFELSEFVFNLYSHHYKKKYQWAPNIQELYGMIQSDNDHFENSVYFGFKNLKQELLGSIKATKKSKQINFPIEYEFNIDIEEVIRNNNLKVNEVWHLGRLAIDSNALREQGSKLTSREILKLLLIHSLRIINHVPNNLMIAESDVLIYQIFQDLGLKMEIVGEVKNCLGSPTYPVILTAESMNNWLKKHENEESVLEETYT